MQPAGKGAAVAARGITERVLALLIDASRLVEARLADSSDATRAADAANATRTAQTAATSPTGTHRGTGSAGRETAKDRSDVRREGVLDGNDHRLEIVRRTMSTFSMISIIRFTFSAKSRRMRIEVPFTP